MMFMHVLPMVAVKQNSSGLANMAPLLFNSIIAMDNNVRSIFFFQNEISSQLIDLKTGGF